MRGVGGHPRPLPNRASYRRVRSRRYKGRLLREGVDQGMNFGASKRQSLSPPLPEETRNATYLGPQWMNPFGHLVARVVGVTELIAETTSSRAR